MKFLKFLEEELPGKSVPIATSGTLSGHAAGEPFSVLAFSLLKKKYPSNIFKQHEFLNSLYFANPQKKTFRERTGLIQSPAVALLLNRGLKPTIEWSSKNPFVEKQNDTSDMIFLDKNLCTIIDIKTTNSEKKSQPPNIVSAFKICKLSELILKTNDISSLDIIYIGLSWYKKSDRLECGDVFIKSLFKIDPSELYINWSAAMQIQFHVPYVSQKFLGDQKQWSKKYISCWLESAMTREKTFRQNYIQPFEKYL